MSAKTDYLIKEKFNFSHLQKLGHSIEEKPKAAIKVTFRMKCTRSSISRNNYTQTAQVKVKNIDVGVIYVSTQAEQGYVL